MARRPALSRALRCAVFRRDRFLCRYCGAKTIPTPIMELLGGLYPDSFPFESSNWRGGVTHPAVLSRSPLVDHVVPGSLGGNWTDMENLVTACNPCNSIKADFTLERIGWDVRPIEDVDWDGLTGLYTSLWEVAGRPKPEYHSGWIRDLG